MLGSGRLLNLFCMRQRTQLEEERVRLRRSVPPVDVRPEGVRLDSSRPVFENPELREPDQVPLPDCVRPLATVSNFEEEPSSRLQTAIELEVYPSEEVEPVLAFSP